MTFEIEAPFAAWQAAFAANAPARAAAGLTPLYCGHDLDNTASVYCLIEAPSLAAFHRFTRVPDNAQRAADAGHLLATAKAVTLS